MPDPRIVVGARCTWWDSIDKVGHKELPAKPLRFANGREFSSGPMRLPCCPHCSSVLYEFEDLAHWNESVESYAERVADKDYQDLIAWSRGQCFSDFVFAREAWKAAGSPKRGQG